MTDLIARIESADGPSRELDAEIARSIGWGCVVRDPEAQNKYVCWRKKYRSGEWIMLPRYTSSIDAALTLVPEGWHMSVNATVGALLQGSAAVRDRDGGPSFTSAAATPALALAAAALKARGV